MKRDHFYQLLNVIKTQIYKAESTYFVSMNTYTVQVCVLSSLFCEVNIHILFKFLNLKMYDNLQIERHL